MIWLGPMVYINLATEQFSLHQKYQTASKISKSPPKNETMKALTETEYTLLCVFQKWLHFVHFNWFWK